MHWPVVTARYEEKNVLRVPTPYEFNTMNCMLLGMIIPCGGTVASTLAASQQHTSPGTLSFNLVTYAHLPLATFVASIWYPFC
jgi:hypothetical protein